MRKLSQQQAGQLANSFLGLAQSVGDYRFKNWNKLTRKENQQLASLQWSLLNYGEDIMAFSATLALDDIISSLEKIQSLTTSIYTTLHKLQNIQKVIDIAAAAVTLGAAIISKDAKAILDGLKNFTEKAKATL